MHGTVLPGPRPKRVPIATAGPAVAEGASPQAYLLLLRFALLNIVGAAFMAAAYLNGWIDTVLAADPTRLVVGIAAVFVAGWAICAHKVWKTSRELNAAKQPIPPPGSRAAAYMAEVAGRDAGARSIAASTLRFKLSSRVRVVKILADSLVFLGLIGTVIGFIMALSGVDPENANDVATVSPMVSGLIEGMSVALYTTLVGAVLNIWLGANYQVLTTGTVTLITTIVARGERHERP